MIESFDPVSRLDGRAPYRSSFYLASACDENHPGAPTYMKFGVSDDPFNRMLAIHWGIPTGLQKFIYIPVCYKRMALNIEKLIRFKLRMWKTRGEWVRLPDSAKEREDILFVIMSTTEQMLKRIEIKELSVKDEVARAMERSRNQQMRAKAKAQKEFARVR